MSLTADPQRPASSRRFLEDLYRKAEVALADEPLSEAALEASHSAEGDGLLFEFKLANLYDLGEHEKLLAEIEDGPYLSAQAGYLEGIRQGSRDLETYVLPAAIARAREDPERGWPRFLRLALVAANFRGLADALADDEILKGLVVHGRRQLAVDVAAQLSAVAVRVRARAVIVAAAPEAPDVDDLLRSIEKDVDDLDLSEEEKIEMLRAAARRVGPQLARRWIGRLGSPEPEEPAPPFELKEDEGDASGLRARLRELETATKASEAGTKATKEISRALTGIAHYLYRVRYHAPAEDLALFLDLVADHLSGQLAAQIENIVWSPGSDERTLLVLATRTGKREVWQELLQRAEASAAALSKNEADGFELRRRLLIELGVRFARDAGDADAVERIAERLLPGEEEDEMRTAVLEALADRTRKSSSRSATRDELIESVYSRLESRRLRLLMGLRIEDDPTELAHLVRPAGLYAGVADTAALEDELHALTALRRVPERPRELARIHLSQVQNPRRRVLALLELAWHALAYQRKRYRPDLRDRTAALQPLTEAIDAVPSTAWRVALTPELVALGAELGPARAISELQEALLHLLGPSEVAWETRLPAFEALLNRLGMLVLQPAEPRGSTASRCRALADLVSWLIQLTSRAEMEDLRSRWHRILPLIVAAVEGLAPELEERLRRPSGFQAYLPRRLRRRVVTPWRLAIPDLLEHWSWLTPAQRPAIAVSCQPPPERLRRASRVLTEAHSEPLVSEARALVALLASHCSKTTLELLRWLPEEERQDSGRCLLRLGCGGEALAVELPGLLEAPPAVLEARLRQPCTEISPSWAGDLAELVAGGDLDPLDPRALPLCRRLEGVEREETLTVLAQRAVSALGRGGKKAGEDVLRLWLRIFLGAQGPEFEEAAATAIRNARSIPETRGASTVRSPAGREVLEQRRVEKRPPVSHTSQ